MSDEIIIEHPNREKAESKMTKATVILLLLGSAALIAIVTIGGWSEESGAQPISIAFAIIFLVMAYYVARWNRGVLPVAAALAIIMAIFAAVSINGWFDRTDSGYADSTIPAGLLGTLTAIIVPVQILLIAFSMRGFQQAWNVEVERLADGSTRKAPQRG
jgi:FtsH-binding integral membrane protein